MFKFECAIVIELHLSSRQLQHHPAFRERRRRQGTQAPAGWVELGAAHWTSLQSSGA